MVEDILKTNIWSDMTIQFWFPDWLENPVKQTQYTARNIVQSERSKKLRKNRNL